MILSYCDILCIRHLLLRHLMSQDDLTTKEEAEVNQVMRGNISIFILSI